MGKRLNSEKPSAPLRVLTLALITLAITSSGAMADQGRISTDELRRLVPGATLKGTVANGETFEGTYFRNGTMAIHTHDDADTGTWEFEDDTICLTWKTWRQGKRYCIYWGRTADGYASYYLDGRLSTRFAIVE